MRFNENRSASSGIAIQIPAPFIIAVTIFAAHRSDTFR